MSRAVAELLALVYTARIFWLGVVGSAAVEVYNILEAYQGGRPLPARYRKPGFWVVRTLMALIGGLLAHLYGVTNHILALHIGASTPLILQTFTRKPPGGL